MESDVIWFWAIQIGLVLFAMFAAIWDRTAARDNLTMQVTRGDRAMTIFYGTYAAISVVLVAICVSADAAQGHRVLWTVVDVLLVTYACLFNGWFRNHLVGLANHLARIERR
jgi:hypothetical protein